MIGLALVGFACATDQTWDGTYEIEGKTVGEGCEGITLVETHVVIDTKNETLYSDYVERTFPMKIVDGRLVAEGKFPHRYCKTTMHEGYHFQKDTVWWLARADILDLARKRRLPYAVHGDLGSNRETRLALDRNRRSKRALEERPVPEDPQPKKYREELVDSVYGGRGKVLSRARLYARGPTKEDPKGVSWTITEASKYLYEDDPEDPGLVRIRRRSNVRTSTETLLSVINNLEPNEGVYWVWERTGYIPRGAKLMRGDISARNACRVTVHDYVTSDEWLAWKRRQAQ